MGLIAAACILMAHGVLPGSHPARGRSEGEASSDPSLDGSPAVG
jgi:hypothetical protein